MANNQTLDFWGRTTAPILMTTLLALAAACGGDGSPAGSGGAGTCPPGQTTCGGTCIDADTDHGNCGECGHACEPGEVCDGSGVCALSCQPQLAECDGVCTDTDDDNTNCGECGQTCPPGEICNGSGECDLTCQTGYVLCDGTCVDPDTDEEHCGAGPDCATSPGEICEAGELCDGSGECAPTCQTGLVACGDDCIDPNTDEAHCGAGSDCATDPGTACDPGEVCDGAGTCAPYCQPGLIACGGTCIDPATNNDHCGAGPDCAQNTGTDCPPGTKCNGSGTCELTCLAGFIDCGVCINPLNNPTYCGAGPDCVTNPGTTCSPGTACNQGACQLSCGTGEVICGGSCVDPLTDDQHCGADATCTNPGMQCSPGENCVGGVCQLDCQAGLLDCGGICTDPSSDEDHCGAGPDCSTNPGTACPPSTICDGGECVQSCPPGFVSCLGSCIDPDTTTCQCAPNEILCGGMCVDPTTDEQYCGASLGCMSPDDGVTCTSSQLCESGACCTDCGGMGCCAAGQVCSGGACIQPLVNGSFETGDFTGWITQDLSSPYLMLGVASSGTSMLPPASWSVTPTDGTYAARHGFDGSIGEISIGQDVTLGVGPAVTLTFDYRAAWDIFGMISRTFEVWIEPAGGGPPLQTTTILTAPAPSTNFDTGPQTGTVDLSAFAGQQVRIRFVWVVPESFSGPGGVQLDDVQIN